MKESTTLIAIALIMLSGCAADPSLTYWDQIHAANQRSAQLDDEYAQLLRERGAQIDQLPPEQRSAARAKLLAEWREFLNDLRQERQDLQADLEVLDRQTAERDRQEQLDAEKRAATALEELRGEVRKYREYQTYGIRYSE